MKINTQLAKTVAEGLKSYVKADDVLLVAVSGGADSIALLDILVNLRKDFAYQLSVVHIHHHLRKASDEEWTFVENVCAKYKVPFYGRHIDVNAEVKGSMEANAHRLRYAAFEEVAALVGAKYICLAHHANDRAETLLANLLRGTSVAGLAAMPMCNGNILRPMIRLSRADIEVYCEEHGLAYVTDESNSDIRITRNRIRHELLPLLKSYNPEIVLALNRLAESTELEQTYLQSSTEKLRKQALRFSAVRWRIYDAEILRKAHGACFAHLLREENQRYHVGRSTLNADMVAHCVTLLADGGRYDLGGGIIFEATSRYVYFGETPKGEWQFVDGKWYHDFLEAEFDCGKELYVRSQQNGDTIRIKNLGNKRVKKVFQEKGIPIVLRNQWPIVCDTKSNEIVWLPFLARSTHLMYYYNDTGLSKDTIQLKLAQCIEQVEDKKNRRIHEK